MNEPEGRLPPHSIEAEQAVLGCALLDKESAARVRALPPEAFYDLRNRAVHQGMRTVGQDGEAIDIVVLINWLKQGNMLEGVGGIEYVSILPDRVPAASNLPSYLAILQDLWRVRTFIKTAFESAEAAFATASNGVDGAIVRLASHTSKAFDSITEPLPGVEQEGSLSDELTVRSAAEFDAMNFSDTDNYIGDRLLAAGQELVIAGAGGIGKSRLLLQLAAAAIVGVPFLGIDTHAPGKRWLILQAENSNRRLQGEMRAIRAWVGEAAWPAIQENLFIHTLEQEHDRFLAVSDMDAQRRLVRCVEKINPQFVGFDSLYNFSSGDLNKDMDMRNTVLPLSRIARCGDPDRAIVVLHHATTGRAGAMKATGFDRSSFGRNSKVLHSWARGQINLAPQSGDSNERLVVSCGKCNNGREFPTFGIALNQETMIYDVDPDFDQKAWQEEMGTGKASIIGFRRVRELCSKPMTKAELCKAVMDDTGCLRTSAYRHIKKAEIAKAVRFSDATKLYTQV